MALAVPPRLFSSAARTCHIKLVQRLIGRSSQTRHRAASFWEKRLSAHPNREESAKLAGGKERELFAGVLKPLDDGAPIAIEHLGWGVTMSDEPQTDEEHYRNIAEKIRELARQTHIPQVRKELHDLADRIEGMATRPDEQSKP